MKKLNVVTGAFSYTGKYITENLLLNNEGVITLTNHLRSGSNNRNITVLPYNFDKYEGLKKLLYGVDTLYNTYWIHFSYRNKSLDDAVENSKKLISIAQEAGIKRIVHISVANPSKTSHLPYFRAKAEVEEFIIKSHLSYAIIRPTLIFGLESIPFNNITYFLRKFPVFPIFGSGKYLVQPIFVGDLAKIAINMGYSRENVILNVGGPDTLTYDELIHTIAKILKSRTHIIHLAPNITLFLGKVLGYILNDVTINRGEMEGLMSNKYVHKHTDITGETRLSRWLEENIDKLGNQYVSELKRYYETTAQ